MSAPSLFVCLLLAAAQAGGSHRYPDAGISQALAQERASRVSNVRYDLSLAVPRDLNARITGREILTFALSDASAPLTLDFDPDRSGRVIRIQGEGPSIEPRQINGHIILPASALHVGLNRLTIEFEAGDAPLNRNADFLYTIFVPARAHEAFPCFDQPDLKARWTLALEVPEGWEALGNGAETSRASRERRTRVTFAETQPVSTYLFAFAAGRFSIERAERNGRIMRMFHRETDKVKVARNREAIFDLHAAALDWMQQYTGIPYSFGKFDFLLVPAFQFGGMEHPGAIFYNASGLLLDPSATQNDRLDRASVISHETAHMWFGDLVTMRWFDDVWLKEVFANFMAAKIVNPSFPGINHDLRFLLDYYPLAYDVDGTNGSNPIRQRLTNLSEAGTLYGNIIYDKAPIVMRQLESLVGPGMFRDGLRDYLKRFSFGNATWSDLIGLLGDRTPRDLASWSHAWVDEDRRPIITTEIAFDGERITRLSLSQRDPDPRRGLLWDQQIDIALGYQDRIEHIRTELNAPAIDVASASGRPAPLFVLANGRGLAYGDIHLDRSSRDWLSGNVFRIGDALTRGSAWLTLWDSMLDGEIEPARLMDLALESLPLETDELNLEEILRELRIVYWRFTTEQARNAIAPRVEHVLRTGLDRAQTQGPKGAYFVTLRSVALTPSTVDWLTSVWKDRTHIPGLTLAETDHVALAQELAIRAGTLRPAQGKPAAPSSPNEWRDIVRAQIERTKDPDRRAQLTFVMPALSADPDERDRFFASLADVVNRRHEPWVLTALRALHHPLRGASSQKYVAPSLAMLRDIQRTGDIFFPKRWTDATLGGYSSREKAADVRSFLMNLPDGYPDRLRRIVLSAADDLFRSAQMK